MGLPADLEGLRLRGENGVMAGLTPLQRGVGRAGLSSLDFQLPERGNVFYFSTPRGEVEITVRPVESQLVQRVINLGWLLGIILAVTASPWPSFDDSFVPAEA